MKTHAWIAVLLLVVIGASAQNATPIYNLPKTNSVRSTNWMVFVNRPGQTNGTVTIQASDFLNSMLSFPNWPIGTGSGVQTIQTNGVNVSSSATLLNYVTGSNTLVLATNTAGIVSIQVNASASAGGAATNVYTNVVYVNAIGTRVQSGDALTNAVGSSPAGTLVHVGRGPYSVNNAWPLTRPGINIYFDGSEIYNRGSSPLLGDWDGAAATPSTNYVYGTGRFYTTNALIGAVVDPASKLWLTIAEAEMRVSSSGISNAVGAFMQAGGEMHIFSYGKIRSQHYDTYYHEAPGPIVKTTLIAADLEAGDSAIELFHNYTNRTDGIFQIGTAEAIAGEGGFGLNFISLSSNALVRVDNIVLNRNAQIGSVATNNYGSGIPILQGKFIKGFATATNSIVGGWDVHGSSFVLDGYTIQGPNSIDPIGVRGVGTTLRNVTILPGASATNFARNLGLGGDGTLTIDGTLSVRPRKLMHANLMPLGSGYSVSNKMDGLWAVNLQVQNELAVSNTFTLLGTGTADTLYATNFGVTALYDDSMTNIIASLTQLTSSSTNQYYMVIDPLTGLLRKIKGQHMAVDWSNLTGIPAGFADGTDDGAGGSSPQTSPFIATTNTPPTLTVGATTERAFHLNTNANFTLAFSGTATNGELISLVVSNYAPATDIVVTLPSAVYALESGAVVASITIASNSVEALRFRNNTNMTGSAHWELRRAGKLLTIAADSNISLSTNTGVLYLKGNVTVATNGVTVGVGTNINWTTGVTGYVSGATLNLGITASGSGVGGGTNFAGTVTTNATEFTVLNLGDATNQTVATISWSATNHVVWSPSNNAALALSGTPGSGTNAQSIRMTLILTNGQTSIVLPLAGPNGSAVSLLSAPSTNELEIVYDGFRQYILSGQTLIGPGLTFNSGVLAANGVLTNLVGTVARNITNFVSLSTSNATSKPLTNSYTSGVLTMFGLEVGSGIAITPNASNLVLSSTGGAGISTNGNQFGAAVPVTIKSGVLLTNVLVDTSITVTNPNNGGSTGFVLINDNGVQGADGIPTGNFRIGNYNGTGFEFDAVNNQIRGSTSPYPGLGSSAKPYGASFVTNLTIETYAQIKGTNFVGTEVLPNVNTNKLLMTGGGSNVVAATVGGGLIFSGGTLSDTFNYVPQSTTNFPLTHNRRMAFGSYWPNNTTAPVANGAIGASSVTGAAQNNGTVNSTNSDYGIIRASGSGGVGQAALNPAIVGGGGAFIPSNTVFHYSSILCFSNSVGTNAMRMELANGGVQSFGNLYSYIGWFAHMTNGQATNWTVTYRSNNTVTIVPYTSTARTDELHELGLANTDGNTMIWYMDGLPVWTNATPGQCSAGTGASALPFIGERAIVSPNGTNFLYWQTMELNRELKTPIGFQPLP